MATSKIVMELPEDHSYVPLARRVGRSLLDHHAVASEDAADIEMLVGELCSNVTRHVRSEEGFFRLTLEFHDGHIALTVEDHGPGFGEAEIAPVGTLRADEDGSERFGGFGLAIVRNLADHVRFEPLPPRGTRVWVQKRLRHRPDVIPATL